MEKIQISETKDVLRQVTAFAKAQGTSRAELYRRAIRLLLAQQEGKKA